MNSRFVFGVLLLLVVFSCDYQKRLYRKGFYVHWNSKVRTHDYEHKLIEPKISAGALTKNQEEVILAHNDKTFFYAKKQKDEPCADTLVFKSGEELVVKILEINETNIKYKRCDYLNGPIYSIQKDNVYMIKFANGTKEHILPDNNASPKNDSKEESEAFTYGYQSPKPTNAITPSKKISPSLLSISFLSLIAGLILSFSKQIILSLLGNLLLIGSLFWSRQAKRMIQQHPDMYVGIGFANFLMYFNLVLWILSLVILFVALSVVSSQYTSAIAVSIFLDAVVLLVFLFTSKKTDW